jgi:undecaprenyl-diphosphatase
VGFIFKDLIGERLFSVSSIAFSNIFFAIILLYAFLKNKADKTIYQVTFYSALFIGFVQCFALIPGASRSGTAITAALLLGLSLKDASKFAFMLGIPTILGALVLLLFEIQTLDTSINLIVLIIGFLVSMIFAFLTIKLFLNFVEKIGMMPFVIYRLLLGAILIFLI